MCIVLPTELFLLCTLNALFPWQIKWLKPLGLKYSIFDALKNKHAKL